MSWKHAKSVHEFTVTALRKTPASISTPVSIPMSTYKNKILLIVNVASKCGTSITNYNHLNDLHEKYHSKGLNLLIQPCNQFGFQEPLVNEKLFEQIEKKFQIPKSDTFNTFQLLERNDVIGVGGLPLWLYLQKHWRTLDYNNPSYAIPGVVGMNTIRWNFTKFLIDGEGKPRVRYGVKELVNEKDVEMLISELD